MVVSEYQKEKFLRFIDKMLTFYIIYFEINFLNYGNRKANLGSFKGYYCSGV